MGSRAPSFRRLVWPYPRNASSHERRLGHIWDRKLSRPGNKKPAVASGADAGHADADFVVTRERRQSDSASQVFGRIIKRAQAEPNVELVLKRGCDRRQSGGIFWRQRTKPSGLGANAAAECGRLCITGSGFIGLS